MDGLNIDHLQNMTTQEGPFSWLTSGKVDAVLDIKFPRDAPDEPGLNALLGELADALQTAASSVTNIERIPGQPQLAKPPLSAPSDTANEDVDDDAPKVIVDIDLRFRDLKAAVPLFTPDLSYVNNALVRPIVAFMKCVCAVSSGLDSCSPNAVAPTGRLCPSGVEWSRISRSSMGLGRYVTTV